MIIGTGIVTDRLSRVAPLGVRFWDRVTGSPIAEGLQVAAAPVSDPDRSVPAVTNKSAVYVFYGLPGMRSIEFGSGDRDFWATARPRRTFTISVSDAYNRFIPFSFNADLPVRGLFGLQCGPSASPPGAAPIVPLYSSAARSVPGAMAVLRAELHLPPGPGQRWGEPAAWAALDAEIPGQAAVRGIADRKGRVALIFPYPEPASVSPSSPPGSPPSPQAAADLRQQEWLIRLKVSYLPVTPVPAAPDLCYALTQPPAKLWSDSSASVPLTGATLRFGRDLIVRSMDATTREPMPVLFVTPAASPP